LSLRDALEVDPKGKFLEGSKEFLREEAPGRIYIKFHVQEGIDAGGLSREFIEAAQLNDILDIFISTCESQRMPVKRW